MPGPTTEVLNEDLKQVSRDVAGLSREFSEFRGEIRAHMKVTAWIGGFVATAFLGTLGATLTYTWQASALNSRVGTLAEKVDALASSSKAQDSRIDSIERAVERLTLVVSVTRGGSLPPSYSTQLAPPAPKESHGSPAPVPESPPARPGDPPAVTEPPPAPPG